MKLEFHPAVLGDYNEALDFYEGAGEQVVLRFEVEYRAALQALRVMPGRFPPYLGSKTFRRVRLRNFPFVVLYRVLPGSVRITVLKHERRRADYGLDRE